MDLVITMPIPTSGDVPPVFGVLFAIAAVAGFAVLVWRVVRYLRDDGGDGDSDGDNR